MKGAVRNLFALAAAALLLAACRIPVQDPPASTLAVPGGWRAHESNQPAQVGPNAAVEREWWRAFGDPVLDALVAQALAQTAQSRAALEIARQNLRTVDVNRAALEAAVSNAEAAVRLAEIDLANTRIIAPRDGQLGQVTVRLGAFVNAGAQLTALVPQTMWVVANMKETQMADVRLGQPVTFTVDALNHAKMRGHVEEISPATGSEFSVITPDNATGNFVKIEQRIPVRVSIDPNQALAQRLRPGMSVVVSIDTAAKGSGR